MYEYTQKLEKRSFAFGKGKRFLEGCCKMFHFATAPLPFRAVLRGRRHTKYTSAGYAGSKTGKGGCGMNRVLIVEDEAALREILRDYLTAKGYETAEAADGEEAVG